MTSSTLKEMDYLKAWGLSALCATVGGFIMGAVIGAMLGEILSAGGVPISIIKVLCGAAGFIAGLPVSYLFFRIFVARFIVRKLTSNEIGFDSPHEP
jgi:hypothetical protein